MAAFKNTFTLITLIVFVKCLNLKNYGIGDNFYASSIAVFKNRAFLSLPRSSCYNNLTNPTLIEVHFNPEHQSLVVGRKSLLNNEGFQNWGKCNELQDAVSVDVETQKARLWILDRGTKKCSPKIIIFSLIANNKIYAYKFNNLPSKNVSSLVIDSVGKFGPKAYIGFSGENRIIVFSLNDKNWWIIKISVYNGPKVVSTERLAVSKTKPVLYVTTDRNFELFYINVTDIRNGAIMPTQAIIQETTATYVGDKLGPSGGMVTDLAGGLNYYLNKDFTVLRWLTSKPLKAEYHDVLRQSYQSLPYVSHLFNGPQNGVWALVNALPPQDCYRPSDRRHFILPKEMPHVTDRIIKLSRFIKTFHGGNLFSYEKLQ